MENTKMYSSNYEPEAVETWVDETLDNIQSYFDDNNGLLDALLPDGIDLDTDPELVLVIKSRVIERLGALTKTKS